MAINLPREVSLRGDALHGVRRYLEAEWRGGDAKVLKCDVALALLRLGFRAEAEELLGIKVKVLPSGVPKWPPDPIPQRFKKPVVTKVVKPNPAAPKSDAHKRFARVKVGLTREQLMARGLDRRDLRVWQKRGWIEMGRV